MAAGEDKLVLDGQDQVAKNEIVSIPGEVQEMRGDIRTRTRIAR